MSQILVQDDSFAEGVRRVADTLGRKVSDPSRIAIIGIHTHGVPLSQRIKSLLETTYNQEFPFGTLDITLYRDDYDLRGVKPRIQSSEIRFSIDDLEVILVDDVLVTGRTVRAAIEALGDYGRPSAIRLAALVDRGHRELPIQPDAIGFEFETDKKDLIKVRTTELDGMDEVVLNPGGLKE